MTTAEIYEQLDRSETIAGHEEPLLNYLVAQAAKYDEGGDSEALAYEIAGLMSAKAVAGLPQDSPYIKVFSLASDLELPEHHRSASEPTGHFTGRCSRCGSRDLWDDATAYGCNNCDAIFSTGDIAPRMIENGTGRDLGPAW